MRILQQHLYIHNGPALAQWKLRTKTSRKQIELLSVVKAYFAVFIFITLSHYFFENKPRHQNISLSLRLVERHAYHLLFDGAKAEVCFQICKAYRAKQRTVCAYFWEAFSKLNKLTLFSVFIVFHHFGFLWGQLSTFSAFIFLVFFVCCLGFLGSAWSCLVLAICLC